MMKTLYNSTQIAFLEKNLTCECKLKTQTWFCNVFLYMTKKFLPTETKKSCVLFSLRKEKVQAKNPKDFKKSFSVVE